MNDEEDEVVGGDEEHRLDDSDKTPQELIVEADQVGQRLDTWLAQQFPTYSRTHLRRAINAATIRVNGARAKAAHLIKPGEIVSVILPALPRPGPEPQAIPLAILYEDDDLAVIDKPPGMVVHPGKGNWAGTLTSALQYHFESLSGAGGPSRPGIVHRLDRDTSGVIAIAKHDQAHFALSAQFAARSVSKEYFAIVVGGPSLDEDVIDLPIGLHPYHREKMAIRRDHPTSRPATTRYRVVERFRGFAALQVLPQTGRTHQIRVHLAHLGCPILCDRQYGSRARISLGELSGGGELEPVLLDRQALHAWRLKFAHPMSGKPLAFEAPVPDDLQSVLKALRTRRAFPSSTPSASSAGERQR